MVCRPALALLLLSAVGCGGGGGGLQELTSPFPRTEPEWLASHQAIVAEARKENHEVAIVGDSIAELMGGSPINPNAVGETAMRQDLGDRKVLNCGIRGDHVETVQWRIEHGELAGQDPKLIILLAGTNNLGLQSSATIAEEVVRLEKSIRKACPNATVLVLGLLPRDLPDTTTRHRQQALNAELARQKFALYRDVSNCMLDSQGQFLDGLTVDRIHPTAAGYAKIMAALKGTLDDVLGPKPVSAR